MAAMAKLRKSEIQRLKQTIPLPRRELFLLKLKTQAIWSDVGLPDSHIIGRDTQAFISLYEVVGITDYTAATNTVTSE
jgi:hypothetical protein